MAIEFKLPELGENIESGDIVKVLVAEGEQVKPNQGVFELETDKAVIEVPSSDGGTVTKIHVAEGQKVNVGQVLLTLEPADAEAVAEPVSEAELASEAEPTAKSEPRLSGSGPGAPSLAATPSRSRFGSAGEPTVVHEEGSIPAGPVVRRLARELGVNLTRVAGSGPHGRILPEDVKGATAGSSSSAEKQGATGSLSASAVHETREPVVPPGRVDHDAWGPIHRDRISQIRRTIAKHMSHSASTIPHVTNFDDADVTELEALRKGVPAGWLGPGIKLTMMPLVLRAVAVALGQHPALNASLDEENEEIVYKEYVNLGVAVNTPRGLVVPVLRGVDRMSILEIATVVGHLAQKARDASFAIEDLRGGTFTVSNLGAVGGTYSTPIINFPEVALLLVGRSRWMPVVRNSQVQTRLMMPLSLSFDHRVVNGAMAGRFLNEVINLLQSPGRLLLQ